MRPQKRRRNPSSKASISTASTPKKAKSSKRPEKPSETGHAVPQHDVVPRNTFQRVEDEPSTHRTLQTGNPHQSNGSSGGNDQQSGPIMEVQIGPRGPVTHPVIPATDKRPPPINHGSNYQQNVNPGMFYSSDRSSDNFMGNLGSIGGVQVCESPASQPSMFDSVSAHIPLKIKEKVWAGEYIDMSLMLKSGKDLVYDSQLNGELAVKGGQLTVLQQKHNQIKNIHTWTSAFINFMSIMLEKWPGKAQVYLKYMHVIRLAASRVSNLGWVSYDEQFHLRKARVPQSSWADVDVELWLLYVSAPDSPFLTEWDKNEHRDFSSDMSKKGIRTCWGYNKGRCTYGNNCRFIHKCSECYGNHPLSACSKS
jgi:hypothetical protein